MRDEESSLTTAVSLCVPSTLPSPTMISIRWQQQSCVGSAISFRDARAVQPEPTITLNSHTVTQLVASSSTRLLEISSSRCEYRSTHLTPS